MLPRTHQPSTLSCLVLVEAPGFRSPTAFTVSIPDDNDSQTFIKLLRDTYQHTFTRFGRFFRKYLTLQTPVVYRVTLHKISVPNLGSLPSTKALIKNVARNDTLTAALMNPEDLHWSFYTHLFDLYDDVFAEIEERDGRTRIPTTALLIRQETRPIAKALLVSLASLIGGAIFMVKFAHVIIDQQQSPV